MQEVKNFSSGVLTNGGAIQRVQDREAKRERERLEKEAYEKHAAESAARRNKAREDRAIELAEQSKARQAAEEEKQRKAAEKSARDEEERLKVVAAKETARLARQQDLDRRLAENKEKQAAEQAAAEVAALLAKQQELERQNQKQTQAAALLDDLSKAPDATKTEASKPVMVTKELEDPEELEELEPEELVLQIVKGAVHVPASIPTIDASEGARTELPAAYDMSALMPAPAVHTVEAAPQSEVQVESGKELIDGILTGAEPAPQDQEQVPQAARSENRFQKIINTNRDLAKENQTLKARVEKLLDEVHGYQVEGELVGSILDTQERAKRQDPPQNAAERYLKPKLFNVVDEAKKEMLKYLSTREDEIDHTHKSVLFLKYMQDPFYMNVFVQNNQASEWWPVIDSIYNSIGLSAPDWSKSMVETYQPKAQPQPQPIRARTATLGSPVASSEQPMDRIAQHLGNMGI
ncbi:MAG: hypothetical protein B7Y05_07460 [Polynucleobacter sp. 24-46-87]|jgi:hypothetical protein|uniref:hypothetical protein n=1 Tax=unclassified Polynucleobacter TaxID=2640945 RepID=UPI000BC5E195|nr:MULTISPECIES: hypothetical protein [unclassified Polynucleobacter]OYY17410.1 MAG: hypothetical protein B7Y67_07900 [Polynucleobacter sp. 35-46-11]OZA14380.1 MAG: hypothetical protein B7Y05_07460 [Polynucleobacter sp. 24-46-87]OZA75575.1 MAG: hypothetical protein B7X71_11230 [Polynucleobacter sp. 39-46-10]